MNFNEVKTVSNTVKRIFLKMVEINKTQNALNNTTDPNLFMYLTPIDINKSNLKIIKYLFN